MQVINIYKTNACRVDSINNPKFYTNENWLSVYALSCGYCEHIEINNIRFTLEKDGCYHVKVCGDNIKLWETHSVLINARRQFLKFIKEYSSCK